MNEIEALIERVNQKESAEQGSAAWLYERVGYCTASRFKDVIDKLKSGKPGAKRQTYLMELVVERITGQPQDHFASTAMQWGTDCEPRSRMDYEARTGSIVEEVGFVKHPTLPMVGGSPDGLIGEDGGFESKSPYNSAVHLGTILEGAMPEEHMAQVQGIMWITGRQWWDFQSFDPRLPEPLNRYVQRIERNEDYIKQLEQEVIAFLAEVEAMLKRLAP
jgi:predicted phage-related endonuclease